MEIKSKQRIIGIVILALIALVILPFLLNHSNTQQPIKILEQQLTAESEQKPAVHSNQKIAPSHQKIHSIPIEQPSSQLAPEMQPQHSTLAAKKIITEQAKVIPAPIMKKQMVKNKSSKVNAPVKSTNIKSKKAVVQKPVVRSPNKKSVKKSIPKAPSKDNIQIKQVKVAVSKKDNWVVQLGSFDNNVNAQVFLKALHGKGVNAYLHKVIIKNKTEIKVVVGRNINQASAINLRETLQKTKHIKGILAKY